MGVEYEYEDDLSLVDPDGGDSVSFHWDEEFQRHIISMLLSDRQFLLQSMDLVKPNYFTNKAHKVICQFIYDYFKQYMVLPNKTFVKQEIRSKLKEDKSLTFFLAEVETLYEYFEPGLDSREYLVDKIAYFAKMQAFRRAFQDGLKLLDQNPESEETWQKIYGKLETVITTSANFDIGTDYFKTMRERYLEENEGDISDIFITGLESIDTEINGGGYGRGQIISIVAGSGVGKSVMLQCITATNLCRGKKGVYITLELAEDKVAQRMDSILTGLPIQNLYGEKDELFEKLANLDGVDYEDKMPLVIKQFPPGTASVNTIRAYLAQLRFHGYVPDFVMVDYVGEMQDLPGMKTYESRECIVRDLRALAVEEKLFIGTAMQPNRGSKDQQHGSKVERIDDNHLADSFGQIRPLDGAISLNQNDSEKSLQLGRGYVIKQRDGKSRYQIYLKFDKDCLRISEIHRDTYLDMMNKRKAEASGEAEIPDFDSQVDSIKKGFTPQSALEEEDDDKDENDENKDPPGKAG